MKIMVTGANGFVGTEVVRQLWADHDVLAVDCLRYGPWRFSEEEMSRFVLATTDLRNRKDVESLVEGFQPHAIIHLAAIHFIPECEREPDEAISTNVQATANLLTATPPGCRFVFASTAAVYGPKGEAHVEDSDILHPLDVYGHTKLAAEKLVEYFAGTRKLEAVIIRLFNVVGPGETNPHVLPEIFAQLRRGERRLRLGNLHPKRDYIFVADVARGFIAAALAPFPRALGPVPIANLGSGASYSVQELIEQLEAVIGENIDVEVDASRVRQVDRPQLLADNTRMREYFGWAPRHDIASSLRLTWADATREMSKDAAPAPAIHQGFEMRA
jgi:UDP-glucose 4-epimerase